MKYIIIDLEWNGAPLYKTGGYFNEIIEIGAVRLDEQLRQVDTFQALVQPKIHKKLTGRVKRLTHISNDEVRNAKKFREIYRDFREWLGEEENCILTWGIGDILVLLENFDQLGINNGISAIHNYCDAQAICQRSLEIDSAKQPGLSAVAEQLGIPCDDMEMHRALDDSIVSAECLRRAWKQELFDELRSRVDEEFIRRITFKTVIISDLKNPLIDKGLFRQRCPGCNARMRRLGNINSRNRGFTVEYRCPQCGTEYVGRHQFKLKYEGIQHKCVLRTREEIEAAKREEAEKALRRAQNATSDKGDRSPMSKKTVAVLFGGRSSEHEVSRKSATMVINNLSRDKYDLVMVGITKEGRWYLYEGDVALIADGSWETSGATVPAVISPDTATHGLLVMRDSGVETVRLDVVFPVLHGRNGEDGTMQGLLELAGIPYVGCDCASSAVCMDKALTNTLLEFGGIPQAKFIWFYAADWAENSEMYIDRIDSELGYPCFVKPANAGSSVGISKCKSRDDLRAAIELAAANDPKIVIEEGIVGAEVETAVMGNSCGEITVSTVGEIAPAAEWYDYDAKYNNAESALFIPGRLSPETMALIKERAAKAYRILGCSGLTRMDFFVRKSDGEVMLNEPNTLPGFTPISMYPKLMEFDGIDNASLVDRLLVLAEERMNGSAK
ncbi:MAG: D-alanine--D-alanine ligase [Ruminococcaceae bacterium]|nr:D-alanine--D-alanine ligase [Oscillospiraceae bacterium]